MSDAVPQLDDVTRFGLLLESAQAHQRSAEAHLERLRVHTAGLDGVVRDEIRRTLSTELTQLTAESARAAAALRRMKRSADMRGLLWAAAIALTATAIPGAFLHWTVPSAAEIGALRARRDQLQSSVHELERRGGLAQWRRCGEAGRLCVRVDKSTPAYGERGEYVVIEGY